MVAARNLLRMNQLQNPDRQHPAFFPMKRARPPRKNGHSQLACADAKKRRAARQRRGKERPEAKSGRKQRRKEQPEAKDPEGKNKGESGRGRVCRAHPPGPQQRSDKEASSSNSSISRRRGGSTSKLTVSSKWHGKMVCSFFGSASSVEGFVGRLLDT